MINIGIVITLLAISFIGDNLLQSKEVMLKKSSYTSSLLLHVATWGIPMWLFAVTMVIKTNNSAMFEWYVFVLIAHFLIEWPLSRLSSSLAFAGRYLSANIIEMSENLLLNSALVFSFYYFNIK